MSYDSPSSRPPASIRNAPPQPFRLRFPLDFPPSTINLFLFILLQTLLRCAKSQLLSFHILPNSFHKTPGVAYPHPLCALRARRLPRPDRGVKIRPSPVSNRSLRRRSPPTCSPCWP